MNDDTVKAFAALFAGRADVNGRLAKGGKGYQDKRPVTLAVYRAHLEGRSYPDSSLGIYPLRDDNTVWWVCGDLDLGDEASAWRVVGALDRLGVRGYVEVSKSKGHHVWVFFAAPTPAYAARRLMARARREAGVAFGEIFPKQDEVTVEAPYGNFVHLPYCGHPDAAGRYVIDREGRGLTLDQFLARVERSECPEWALENPPQAAPPRWRAEHGVYRGERAACVQRLIDGPVAPGSRNEALVRLAAHLVNTEELVGAGALVEDAATRWGLPASEARATLASVRRKGYQFGCVRKREVPEMAAACTWEACPFHRTPDRARFVAEEEPAPTPAPVEAFGPDEEARLRELIAPHGFLRHYMDYATTLSDAPPMAHLAAALTLVSTALGNRVWAQGFAGLAIRPNLWIVFVAESGARKSSVMSKAMSFMLRMERAELMLLSNGASMERWLAELAQHPARLLHADEFVGLLNHLERKHMQGARELLTALFASDRYVYATKTDGKQTIDRPALCLLAGCTPTDLEEHARRKDFAVGFLARVLFLPAIVEGPEPETIPRPNVAAEDALLARLEWMASLAGEITFSEAINRRLCAWAAGFKRQERAVAGAAIGLVNRAFDFAIKLAMVFQVAETPPGVPLWRDLDPEVVERAIALAEWLVRRTIRLVNEDLADSDFERDVRRALDLVRQAGGELPRWKLLKALRVRADDFDKLVGYTLETGELIRDEVVTETRRGAVYRLPRRGESFPDFPNLSHNGFRHRDAEKGRKIESFPENGTQPQKGSARQMPRKDGKDSVYLVGTRKTAGKDSGKDS